MALLRIGLMCLLVLVCATPAPAQNFSPEEYVRNLYRRYMGREPRSGEVELWARNIRNGMSLEEVQVGFLSADEFFRRHRNDPSSFIVGLYNEVLGRNPNPDEVAGWLNRLARLGGNRSRLVRDFFNAAQTELSQRPGSFPPSGPDLGGPLVAAAQQLVNAVQTELGFRGPGRQALVRANTLLQACENFRQVIAVPNFSPVLAWQHLAAVEAAFNSAQEVLANFLHAAPTCRQALNQIGALISNFRASLPGTQPSFPPPSSGIDQGFSDRCGSLATALTRSTERLVRVLRRNLNDNLHARLIRDAEDLAAEAEAFSSAVRVGASLNRLRSRFAGLRDAANGISSRIRQANPRVQVLNAWQDVVEDLRRLGEALGVSGGLWFDPDRPVLVNPPTFGQVPWQPLPGTSFPLPPEAAQVADTAVAQLDAFLAGVSRFALYAPGVWQVQTQAQSLRGSLAQMRQEIASGASRDQLRSRQEEINVLFQQMGQTLAVAAQGAQLQNVPDLAPLTATVQQLNQLVVSQ
jgi:hypothetical protein